MYLVLIIAIELLLFGYYIPYYISILVFFVYALWYFDGKEYTGERRWDAFRSLSMWKWVTPIQYIFPNKSDIAQTRGKRLFVMPVCVTTTPLLWGVGLHGGAMSMNQPIHFVVPPPYMWVPFLRDVLMWMGGVSYSLRGGDSRGRDLVIQNLLDNGRIVVYAPSNFYNPYSDTHDVEAIVDHRYPSNGMIKFCIDQSVSIIPVIVSGETERYKLIDAGAVQKWTYSKVDYPLPHLHWFRFFSASRPPLIVIKIGPCLTCNLYRAENEGIEQLKKSLRDTVLELSTITAPIIHKTDKAI